jgi:Mor family transcriptional regulator
MLDMVAKRRQPLGERNGRAKLTLRQVLNIRGSSGKAYNDLAKTYDVSAGQISRIVRRKKWASV